MWLHEALLGRNADAGAGIIAFPCLSYEEWLCRSCGAHTAFTSEDGTPPTCHACGAPARTGDGPTLRVTHVDHGARTITITGEA